MRVFSIVLLGVALAAAAAQGDGDTETCSFSVPEGTCTVPGAKKKCCALTKCTIDAMMNNDDAAYDKCATDNGVNMAEVEAECPALAAAQKDPQTYCTENCSFSVPEGSCTVPGAKKKCCALMKCSMDAMMNNDDAAYDNCATDNGVNMAEVEAECPALTEAHKNPEKYCTPPARLFGGLPVGLVPQSRRNAQQMGLIVGGVTLTSFVALAAVLRRRTAGGSRLLDEKGGELEVLEGGKE